MRIIREIASGFAGALLLPLLFVCPAFAQVDAPAQAPDPKIIRSISIKVNNIFEGEDLGWLYRAANAVKPNTQEHVVRRELLFKEGDVYDPFRIQESERFLRALPFLRQIFITPTFDGNFVDIVVNVQDMWTFVPFISYSTGGGRQKEIFGLAETNAFGYGQRVELLYGIDEGRQRVEGVWENRRLFDTYQQLTVGHSERSDGNRSVVYYGRPFRSLVEPQSWSLETETFDLVGRLFSGGEERFIFRQKREHVNLGYTIARGDPKQAVWRYTGGYEYAADRFFQATDEDFDDADVDPTNVSRDPSMLASDRRFSGPSVAMQRIEPDFISLNYVDRFDRVEDFNLGNELIARATLALDALGSYRDTLLLSVNESDGFRLDQASFVRGRIGASTRLNTDSFANSIFSGDIRYANVRGPKYLGDTYLGQYTDIASFEFDYAVNLDKDREILLGASNGLRGYEDRAFTGSAGLSVALEERIHLVDDIYRLVSLGAAVFVDAGGVGRNGFGNILDEQLYSDVGIGLRLGFPRSSGGGIVRFDLAFPTRSTPDGEEAWAPRLLITTGQSISARLPNEATLNPGANVALKFLP